MSPIAARLAALSTLIALVACAELEPELTAPEGAPVTAEAKAKGFSGSIYTLQVRRRSRDASLSMVGVVSGIEEGDLADIGGLELEWEDGAVTDLQPFATERAGRSSLSFTKAPSGYTYSVGLSLKGSDDSDGGHGASLSTSVKLEVDGEPQVVAWDAVGDLSVSLVSTAPEEGGGAELVVMMVDHIGEDGSTSAHWSWSGSASAKAADGGPSATAAEELTFDDEVRLLLTGDIAFNGNPLGYSYQLDGELYDSEGKHLTKDSIELAFELTYDGDDDSPELMYGFGKGTRSSASNAAARPELL